MRYLQDVFEHAEVSSWIDYAGRERLGRIDPATGAIGKNNLDWQSGFRTDYFIEAQRVGYQVILGGLASEDVAMVSRGFQAIEWGFQPSVLGPNNDWSANREFNDILAHAAHPRTMFGSAAVKSMYAILVDDNMPSTLKDRAMQIVDRIQASASSYIVSGDALVFREQCVNSSQLVFQATWMQGAYRLTGLEGFKTEAKDTIRTMMDMQLEDGAFGEQGGFDTSYSVQTIRELVVYREMLSGDGLGGWKTKVSDYITAGVNWLLGRIAPDGSIDTTGNERTSADGPPQEGSFAKGWDLDQIAITLAQYAVAFGRWDELAPVITAVQYRGQEYDHIRDVASPQG